MADTKDRSTYASTSLRRVPNAFKRLTEEEKRALRERLPAHKPLEEMNAAERIHHLFADIGFEEGEFVQPDRSGREPPDFS